MTGTITRGILLLAMCLLLLPSTLPAPIYGLFTGFDRLAAIAPYVGIVRVSNEEGLNNTFGLHVPYDAEIVKMVKGTLPDWALPEPAQTQAFTYDPQRRAKIRPESRTVTMSLRPQRQPDPRIGFEWGVGEPTYWLVFFKQEGPEDKPRFSDLNTENNAIPLHPETFQMRFESADPVERVEAVLEKSIELHERDAQRLRSILEQDKKQRAERRP